MVSRCVVIDVAALKAAAERADAGPLAVVSRTWLNDVLDALLAPERVKLLGHDTPAAMVAA